MRFWLLIGGFLVLVGLLAVGLRLDPHEVPSPLIGKPAPAFELPLLQQPDKRFSQKDMLGTVWVMNVWASWCPPCLVEHPVVSELARSGIAPVVGLNYKDAREDALPWLKRNGDPFKVTVFDAAGRIAIDYGVYGVPETYVIDRQGVIRYKHIGPLTPQITQKKLRPLIEELSKRG
ncbi:MAG TPA: DsbE family thiol:disulfide interchange protein [Burkholderiales bacterium]|nr:DsbE family thiol:disulfide interchange protein [Burkholderiales bacterium]